MPERRYRVLLADDHPMMLEGLRKLLEPDFDVVGAVSDGGALVEAAARQRPDLVIAGLAMRAIDDGIEVTRRLRRVVPGVRVLILSTHTEPSWVRATFAAGACGYLTKTSAAEEIELAVREVLKNRLFVSQAVTWGVLATTGAAAEPPAAGAPAEGSLTPRETDIVHLVGQGLGNKEIARRLGVSVTTVRTHLSKVYDKLGSSSRVELALLAAQGSGALM